jgi:hypothetical protein
MPIMLINCEKLPALVDLIFDTGNYTGRFPGKIMI